ncbi:hypothetical protein KFL_001370190 [Klebsormidium nitens]|uniref:MYND-type domain-containing protein n=1 Tax=Klebsormidium nitens TaxID=105231 RepID=A0A1Y1I126_KLENI|nr:hypothetical protein KFL_001370190 [Klebsormidium nitens]|eukprot:GAQ83149.1 hypothetical protein KFL_001370190 [Klebsormidium nitens]
MDEDFDQLIKRCAVLLSSEVPEEINRGVEILQSFFVMNEGEGKKLGFARIAQEITAYHGGVVLNQLWIGTLGQVPRQDDFTAFKFMVVYGTALAYLSSSKVFVERTLRLSAIGAKERQAACKIYRELSGLFVEEARLLQKGEETYEELNFRVMMTAPLQIVANFARGSEAFREAMREVAEQQSLFDYLGPLLSQDFLNKLPAEDSFGVRAWMTRLVTSLAFAADSQLWALERGLLKLIAAIYEASPLEESKRIGSPFVRCTALLLYLLEMEATAERMRVHNALSGFKPHKQKINCSELPFKPWRHIEAKLRKYPVTMMTQPRCPEQWKVRAETGVGHEAVGTPVVCSWKLCKAGPEPVIGKKFGKCAICQVSRYCSKDHQKLHWPTHKVHCQAGATRKPAS